MSGNAGVWGWLSNLPGVREALLAAAALFLSGYTLRGVLTEWVSLPHQNERRLDELEPKVNYVYCFLRYTQARKDPAACAEQLPPEMRDLP